MKRMLAVIGALAVIRAMIKAGRKLKASQLALLMASKVVEQQKADIHMLQIATLTANQTTRDLAIAFCIALDQEDPNIIRDDLNALVVDLSDQISKMEEQIV